MSSHLAWAMVCRLFASGKPVLRATLTPGELAVIEALGRAIKPATTDQSFVLCPACMQHRVQVWGNGQGGRAGRCPECGLVEIEADDGKALMLDETWFQQKLRLALEIESRDAPISIADGVWRLGDARRAPVVLARDVMRVWREPTLLDRVRVVGSDVRLIAPRPFDSSATPFGAGVQWLVLDERFAFYGGGISFIDGGAMADPTLASDPATPVHGPFSADFRWVTLDGETAPIRCTDAQAAIFRALWSFKGVEVTAEQIMRRAGLDSDKPIDLFKAKAHAEAKRTYQTLVVTQQRAGLYAMPCASSKASATPPQINKVQQKEAAMK
ncbi:hypothetical protein [Ottowia testudinis]|uniref:Uncharacterized protein n=1 Tax=Ottowia testudinis TaxID=2816950 RepID=A0A975H2M3_9BURK|nr:hypothetical protein [Ottowia testudinis]QTD45003.1 hypothetical protein J1M35_18490 [Ottowia testudinis]